MQRENYLIVIGGPTASGKTKLSIKLSQFFSAPILSADSRQFYKEMNIGTAKPTPTELKQAPHFFVNTLSIEEAYSVGQYEQDALALLEKIYAKQNVAIMVGGSGLFIKAVCEGLDTFPDIPKHITTDLRSNFDKNGLKDLVEELAKSDPEYYEVVDTNNPHRIIRALSVCRASGKPFSSFWQKPKPTRFFKPIYIAVEIDREELYERINKRVDLMIKSNLEKEAKNLYGQRSFSSLNTVGYSEFFRHFDGELSLEETIELIKRNSRRYAKRQLTWLRRDSHWTYHKANMVKNIIDDIERIMS